MIENIIGFFDDNVSNINMVGGNPNQTQDLNIKKIEYLIYDMMNNSNHKLDYSSESISDSGEQQQIKNNNLMRTLLIPLPNATTITVGIFIRSGSRQETEAYGIAHFLEHMTFKGTTKRTSTQLMIDLDSIGSQYNAMTAHEFTLYHISGDPRDILVLLDIITDLYLDPLFPSDDIEKERNVVYEELIMNEDNNNRFFSNYMYAKIFSNIDQTLARPIIGYKETVQSFNRKSILNYRNKFYMGSNCLLAVSGNFEKDSVIEHIEKIFNSKLERFKHDDMLFRDQIITNDKIIPFKTLDPTIKQYIHYSKDINQTLITFFFNTFGTYNSHTDALDLLTDILSNGFSSRLFDLLRNKMGVSYNNSSVNRTYNDTGHFIISVSVDTKSTVIAIEGILNELKKLVKEGISDIELARAKKQNETNLLFQFKDPNEYMMYYGMHLLTTQPLYSISNMIENIQNATKEQIINLIKKIFIKSNIIIGTMGNLSKSNIESINKLIDNF
jgi:predicted Zn-dependent peptidase